MKEVIKGQCLAKANHYMSVGSEYDRRIIKDDAIREYERSFIEQCKIYKDRLISYPFKLVVDVFFKSKRYDLDGSLKTILDCLQYAKAIKDDNLCISIIANKHIDVHNPRIELELIETQPTLF